MIRPLRCQKVAKWGPHFATFVEIQCFLSNDFIAFTCIKKIKFESRKSKPKHQSAPESNQKRVYVYSILSSLKAYRFIDSCIYADTVRRKLLRSSRTISPPDRPTYPRGGEKKKENFLQQFFFFFFPPPQVSLETIASRFGRSSRFGFGKSTRFGADSAGLADCLSIDKYYNS